MKITIDTDKVVNDILNSIVRDSKGDPLKVIKNLVPVVVAYENRLSAINDKLGDDLFLTDKKDIEQAGALTIIINDLKRALFYYNMRLCGYDMTNKGRWEHGGR